MTIITRRGAGLAAGALLLAPDAQAQPQPQPQAPEQRQGFWRFKVGAFTATIVNDGYNRRPVEGLVMNAPVPAVQQVLAESFLPTTSYDGPYNIPFLDTGRELIAFDTGTGGQMAPTAGRMAANMAAAGLDPARVTLVVLTHCHQDHIHGLATADGRAVFPNAEVAMPEAEWAWWTDAGNETRSPQGQRINFPNVAKRLAPYQGKVRRFAAGAEVVPGVRALAAFGHTPGHCVFHVADGGAEWMVLADITHRPELFMRRPDFVSLFEFDGAAAMASRRRVLDQVAQDRVLVSGYHFPFPSTGHVARDGEAFRYYPAPWL